MLTYDQLIKSDASNPEAVKALTTLLGIPTGGGADFYSNPKNFTANLQNFQRMIGEQVAGARGSSPSGEFQKFGEYQAWGGDVSPLQAQLKGVQDKYAAAGVDFNSSPLAVLNKIAGLAPTLTPEQNGSRVTSQNYGGNVWENIPAPKPGITTPQPMQQQYNGPTTTRLNPQTGLLEKVPASSVVADQLPMAVSQTVSPNQLTTTANMAGLFPTIANGSASGQTMGNIGNLGLSALDQALLQFQAQQQELVAGQRQQAENQLAQAQQGLNNIYSTSRESEIARILKESGIKEKQAALSDLKTKMAQAQEALGLGMQQENGRIAPMSIIGRRQQLLVEQAQGKIGALAAIANVYADDLEQAWNVANLTIDAMNQDRQEKINAYQFLITANENKIVNLKAEEKEAINSQIGILKDAQAKAEANKDKLMGLMLEHTVEFQRAKISLTDDFDTALAKIQPELAKTAGQKLALEEAQKKADIAKTQAEINKLRGGSGGGGGAGGGGVNGKLSNLTLSIIDNPSLFDDLTPTKRGIVISELQANNYDTSNLGTKSLSDTAIKEISQTQKALEDLSVLQTSIENNQQYIGPIKGFARLNPWSKARKVQADIDRVKQTVGKALEGGVLRKEDEEKYKKILPVANDTPETVMYKLSQITTSLNKDIENYKSLQQSGGRSLNVGASLPKKSTGAKAGATSGGNKYTISKE